MKVQPKNLEHRLLYRIFSVTLAAEIGFLTVMCNTTTANRRRKSGRIRIILVNTTKRPNNKCGNLSQETQQTCAVLI